MADGTEKGQGAAEDGFFLLGVVARPLQVEVFHKGHVGRPGVGTVVALEDGGIEGAGAGVAGGGLNSLADHGGQKNMVVALVASPGLGSGFIHEPV